MDAMDEYAQFLNAKASIVQPSGFDCDVSLNALLFPFQRDIVKWALRRGKAAIWADCGLGKSFMQLEWANHVHRHTGKPVLIFTPLAVAEQTAEEARKFAVPEVKVVAGIGECINGINISNYEKLHHFTPEPFGGIVLDESSILKALDGKTRKALTEFSVDIPYRLAFYWQRIEEIVLGASRTEPEGGGKVCSAKHVV